MPYLAELLADLWDLGSSPALIKGWLEDLQLPPESSVLDLGCGKGAVSLTLARDLGFRVHGVDLFEPFVREARARAEEWGLASRCRFENGDLREVARTAEDYDVVVYASVGALGRLDEAVGALRRCVREGGYVLVDDGFLVSGGRPERGLENMTEYREARRRLTAHGDELLREKTLSLEEMRALDARYIESIEARAEALAAAHPEDAALARSYVARQRSAAAFWEQNAVSATWLLRRV